MEDRWLVGLRWFPSIPVDRARLRATLMYKVSERLRLGAELNPLDEEVGPIANWLVVTEEPRRPALMLGTSSARIGTEKGRAIYGTASKDLEAWTGLPLAPYVGVSYDGADNRFRAISGLNVRLAASVTTTHFYDGKNLHHMASYSTPEGHGFGLIAARVDNETYLGVNYSLSFGGSPASPSP